MNLSFLTVIPYLFTASLMVVSVLWERKCFILSFVIAVSCCNLGHALDDPAEATTKDLLCFNNKLIYIGCDDGFRLNQSGIIHVPPDATDRFCNGPCLLETKLLLTCIDKIGSNYEFNNKATSQDIRNALDAGCSNTYNRGGYSCPAQLISILLHSVLFFTASAETNTVKDKAYLITSGFAGNFNVGDYMQGVLSNSACRTSVIRFMASGWIASLCLWLANQL